MGLGSKSVGAFFWASSQQVAVLVINLVVSIWLARILDPYEFGLIGMIAVFISVGTVLMNGGLSSSLIRTKNPTQLEFSSVFFANIVFSLVIYGIIFLTAPLIAAFFDRPVLVDLIRVYSLVIIIYAFSSLQLAKLTKSLNFKRAMTLRLPAIVSGGIVGLYMAYNGFGVWSLVGLYVSQAFLNSVLLWLKSGWRPSWQFSMEALKHHWSFGVKLSLSGLLDAVYQNIYNLVIGKYFSAQTLGYYTRSYTLVAIPVLNIQEILDKVTFPLLATIQDDDKEIKRVYKRIFQAVTLIILPILLIGIIVAEPLFRFMLTEKWLPAVPFFQLICLAGIFLPLSKNNLNILKVKGESGLYLRLGILEKVVVTCGLLLIVPFGLYAMLWFQVIAAFLSFLLNGWVSGRRIQYYLVEQLKDFLRLFLIAVVSAAFVYWIFLKLHRTLHDVWVIVCCSGLFLLLYVLLLNLFQKVLIHEVISILKRNKIKDEKGI